MSDWSYIDATASFIVPQDDACRTIAVAHAQVKAKCADAPPVRGQEGPALMAIERAGHVEHGYKFNVVVRGCLRGRRTPEVMASWKELVKFLQRVFGCEITEEHVCVTASVDTWLRSTTRGDNDKKRRRK